jgi:hypothetical protein
MLKSLALGGTAFVFLVRAGIGLIGWTDHRSSMAFAAKDKDWSSDYARRRTLDGPVGHF